MGNKLKLSAEASEKLDFLSNKLGFKRFIICRLAISSALAEGFSSEAGTIRDSNGTEFNKSTILGGHEHLYRALVTQAEGRLISDGDFFPIIIKQFIEQGLENLHSEYEIINSPSRFLVRFLEN